MMQWRSLLLLVLLPLMASCAAPVSVDMVDQRSEYRRLARNAMSSGELSEETRNALRRRALLEAFQRQPGEALAALHEVVVRGEDEPGELFAMAEMSYLHGKGAGGAQHLLAAAIYAYAHLFSVRTTGDATTAFDPRFRQALDLYNLALSEALTEPDGHVVLRSGPHALPFGTIDIAVDEPSLKWAEGRLSDFLPATRMRVSGLQNIYRRAGLGAPVAVATPAPPSIVSDDPLGRPGPGVAVAAHFRVPGTVVLNVPDPAQQLRGTALRGTMRLLIMFDTDAVSIRGQRVPLEYRPTAAFAQGLQDSNIWSQEFRAFLFGDLLNNLPSQLTALAPHRRGRIPVVMVHGTASSSGRWSDMVNDLISDPVIEANYEFWFFTYATGNPVAYSALQLRQALSESLRALGGVQADPALGQIVLIGHSQGGLLAKMMAIDPADSLWAPISRRPPEQLQLSATTLDLVRRAFFFESVPAVRRVVFIATPHGGSVLTDLSITRLLARLITLPATILEATFEILAGNPDAVSLNQGGPQVGSLASMSPGSPFLRALRAIPLSPRVAGHSIIAVRGDGPAEQGNDGVVRFESAFLPGMESTVIVRSGHSAQSNPHTVNEVRRILLRHLDQICGPVLSCAGAAGRRPAISKLAYQ